MRKPDVVHLSLPISIEEKREHINSDRLSYRSPTINQHATLIQGTRLGVVADPAQAHSLRILASPGSHVDGEGGFLHPPRCAPKPLRKARVPLSMHISCGTVLPGFPAQVLQVPRDAARLSPFRLAVQYTTFRASSSLCPSRSVPTPRP